jgi:hypothetical protein
MKTSCLRANSWNGPFIEVMQAERANVTANVLHPGVIDTNFGKGQFPFSFNKYVEGNNWLPCFTNLILLQNYLLVSHEHEEICEQNSSNGQDKVL